MPVSRKRAKTNPALSGLPGRVVALSPREWPDARRAAWCRAYLAGAAAPHLASPPRQHQDMRTAFRLGQREASSNTSEIAQMARQRETRAARRERDEARRDAMSRGQLFGRLDALANPSMGSPHDDPFLRALAGAALMAGGSLVPGGDR